MKELQPQAHIYLFAELYRRFLPGIAKVLRPLMDALHGDKSALDEVPWSPGMDAAFSSSKKALDSPFLMLTRFLELP